jgi:molecular chaperone HtpG
VSSSWTIARRLRFVRGGVDSPDLPLNVSREMLQQSAPLEKIKSNLTNKLLRTLAEMKLDEAELYLAFYKELGPFLKEGVYQDRANREQLADLLLLESTNTEPGKFTTLQSYVDGMKPDQSEIYFLTGENRELIEHSPLLEGFREKGWEVLLLTDPIDELVVQALTEYKGKKLKAVDKGDLGAGEIEEAQKQRYQPLVDFMKGKLGEVKDVRLSHRLKESAACLVADEWGVGANLERLMHRMGRAGEVPESKRILELNPTHPAVEAIQKLHARDAADPRLEKYCRILYDEAVITEGSRVKDPVAFTRRLNELLVKDATT